MKPNHHQNHPENYVAAGFRTDCQELLRRFAATESVRYSEFSNIWREMKFSLIFCGRRNERDLLLFCEEALRIAKVFWLPPHDFQSRVGGLYLLYGLYVKQPKDTYAKIRITIQEWREVQCWVGDLAYQQHYDTLYIYWKLILLDAFHFVYTVKELRPNIKDSFTHAGSPHAIHGFLESYAQDPQLEQLEILHARYNGMKEEIQSTESIAMINTELFEQTDKLIDGYLKKRMGSSIMRDSSAAESMSESEEDPDVDIGAKRSRIKHQQFQRLSKASRSRRHRQGEMISTSEHESPSHPKSSRHALFSSTSGFIRMGRRDPAEIKRKGKRQILPEPVESDDQSSDNREFEEALQHHNMPMLAETEDKKPTKRDYRKSKKSSDKKKRGVTWADSVSSGFDRSANRNDRNMNSFQKRKSFSSSGTGRSGRQNSEMFEKFTPSGKSGNNKSGKRSVGRPRKVVDLGAKVDDKGPKVQKRPRKQKAVKKEPV